jgi:hypothetical protein
MWHFHPDWSLHRLEGPLAFFEHADGARMAFLASAPLRQPDDRTLSQWAPEYGRIEPAVCLEAAIAGEAPLRLTACIPCDGTLQTAHELSLALSEG